MITTLGCFRPYKYHEFSNVLIEPSRGRFLILFPIYSLLYIRIFILSYESYAFTILTVQETSFNKPVEIKPQIG